MNEEALKYIWPEWRIVKEIGRGASAVVYEAERPGNQFVSHCAIKIIAIPQSTAEVSSLEAEGLTTDATRQYFRNIVDEYEHEIQLMESFKALANIVSIEDYKIVERTDEVGFFIFIRMELLTPFNSYIKDHPLDEAEVLKLGIDICSALELIESRGVIHRDIKPENIFVNEFGDFKLGDFGIAREMRNGTGGLSQKGTYLYLAPEVERSNHYDNRVDIYSLGLVLHRLLNDNYIPFIDNAEDQMNPNARIAAIRRRLGGEPLPLPRNCSETTAGVINCACDYFADNRFINATVMKRALQHAQDELNMQYVSGGSAYQNYGAQENAAQSHQMYKGQAENAQRYYADQVSNAWSYYAGPTEDPNAGYTRQSHSQQTKKGGISPVLITLAIVLLIAAIGIIVGVNLIGSHDDAVTDAAAVHDAVAEHDDAEDDEEVLDASDIAATATVYKPFYGVWCYTSGDEESAQDYAGILKDNGYDAHVMLASQWEELDDSKYYMVTCGMYETKDAADSAFKKVKKICPDAYVKYTGEWHAD